MGISFFQIGFIDESKHALALSSKKVKEKNLSYEIVFFFYSTRIKYKYLPSNGINRKYRVEKVSIHIKSRSLFSITRHR